MIHFFIKPKIHLDCFTSRRDVIEYAPVVNAIDVIPEWWRELPKSSFDLQDGFTPRPTMKTCVGMIDYYAKSVALPLWSDLAIEVNSKQNYAWQFSDIQSIVSVHGENQYKDAPFTENNVHLKIETPWLFQTKSDIDWLLTEPIYNNSKFNNYVLAQGLLNFSRQVGANLQLFLDVSTPKKYVIPFGSIFMFTPLSDKKVVIHRHLVDLKKYDSIEATATSITFINKYRNQQKITKCPYRDEIK